MLVLNTRISIVASTLWVGCVAVSTREPRPTNRALPAAQPAEPEGRADAAEERADEHTVREPPEAAVAEEDPAQLPEVDAASAARCLGILPKDELCTCLTLPDWDGPPSCRYEPVKAGFGLFHATDGTPFVVFERAGGLQRIGAVSTSETETEVLRTRLHESAGRPLLRVDIRESWDPNATGETAFFCPLRDESVPGNVAGCLSIPTSFTDQDYVVGTHEPVGPVMRSRLTAELTPDGHVLVKLKGKLQHEWLREHLGKHPLPK